MKSITFWVDCQWAISACSEPLHIVTSFFDVIYMRYENLIDALTLLYAIGRELVNFGS